MWSRQSYRHVGRDTGDTVLFEPADRAPAGPEMHQKRALGRIKLVRDAIDEMAHQGRSRPLDKVACLPPLNGGKNQQQQHDIA